MEPGGTNVQVAVRCRPINSDEEARGFVPIVAVDTEKRQVKINYGACKIDGRCARVGAQVEQAGRTLR